MDESANGAKRLTGANGAGNAGATPEAAVFRGPTPQVSQLPAERGPAGQAAGSVSSTPSGFDKGDDHAELLAVVTQSLCTRTLNLFAQESRLDGESLMDAVHRYEIDYAWQVLGSGRMGDETVALLERKLRHVASDAQKTCVSEVLKAASARQSSDLLMSFDNDVPEHLAAMLFVQHERSAAREAEALS